LDIAAKVSYKGIYVSEKVLFDATDGLSIRHRLLEEDESWFHRFIQPHAYGWSDGLHPIKSIQQASSAVQPITLWFVSGHCVKKAKKSC
jgi:hypothetical protein